MRKFKMQIVECIPHEGKVFNCTVIEEIADPRGIVGLVVSINPPAYISDYRDPQFIKDIKALFGRNQITKAVLFPRIRNLSISPRLTTNPADVYFLLPKGRTDWQWGEFYNSFWALLLEEGDVHDQNHWDSYLKPQF